MHINKYIKGIFVILSGLLIISITVGWSPDMSSSKTIKANNSKNDSVKTTDEVFKNIKVLKGLPAYQLLPTMHFIQASLGLDCSSCHVRNHFASDKKAEKRKARKMIKMVEEINKNNFDGKQLVTCFTCHHGNAQPKTIPVVMTAAMMQTEKDNKDNEKLIMVPNRLNTAEEIIAKYQKAIGGKNKFEKINSLKMEGTVYTGNGRNFPITIYQKAPDSYYSSSVLPFGKFERGYNGKVGWEKNPRGVRKIGQPDIQDLKLDADIYAPINFLKNYSHLKFNDVSTINQDTVYEVNGISSKIRRYKFYFSTRTGLLLRKIQYDKTLLGNLQTQTDYKDYKPVNGILFPFEMHVANYERNENIKFSDISANAHVSEKMFEMPPKGNNRNK